MAAIRKHLGERARQVQRILGGDPIDRLREPVPQPVVSEGVLVGSLHQACQPVGSIVGISARLIREQVAVVVPGEGGPTQVGQAVGGVIPGAHRPGECRLAQPVAHRVVAVVEEAAIGVVGGRQAVEGNVDVGDPGITPRRAAN